MKASPHEALLTSAARGDDAALSLLVRAYHDRVCRFGIRVCHDGFDADDAVQEAFTKLAKRRDVIADPGALSWLFSVVRNACLRMLRRFAGNRRGLGEPVDLEEIPARQENAQEALERLQLVQSVHAAIAALERPYREVVVLRDLEGLSGEQTCAALGLETATMKTRLHRARAKLREALVESRAIAEREGMN
jgi:RNA polymerase sigma-70 factor (ECF subfamily)